LSKIVGVVGGFLGGCFFKESVFVEIILEGLGLVRRDWLNIVGGVLNFGIL
jgi:hypothetical protein